MNTKVKIYTTPTCVYCRMAKDYFQANNIPYEEVNVSGNEQLINEMVEKSHQRGVPVIEIGNQIIVGFDRKHVAQALGLPA